MLLIARLPALLKVVEAYNPELVVYHIMVYFVAYWFIPMTSLYAYMNAACCYYVRTLAKHNVMHYRDSPCSWVYLSQPVLLSLRACLLIVRWLVILQDGL